MKYCKKCGMLLEDNMEICIGCGSNVTRKDTYTKYPEPMQEKIELEKKEEGKRNLAVLAIVLIFVVILLLIGIFIAQTYINESGKTFFTKITADKKLCGTAFLSLRTAVNSRIITPTLNPLKAAWTTCQVIKVL